MPLAGGFGNVSRQTHLIMSFDYMVGMENDQRPLLIEGYWSAALCVIGNSCTRWKGNGRQGNHCKHQKAKGAKYKLRVNS